jgi:exopolyphosphatase/guanosine-5'-triphosphate,3'-diphosphate pyrophosphatase
MGDPFPLRVAAIDLGSNGLRCLAVEAQEAGRWTTLYSERYPIRLGHDVFVTGRLSQPTLHATFQALSQFLEALKAHQVDHYQAVATSALRESENGEDLLRRARKELGLAIQVITGSEEARLIHRAVRGRVNLDPGPWLLADLGGGSVEVILADAAGILWSQSHTMGAVRLLEELVGSGEEPGRFLRLLTEYISTLRIPSGPRQPVGMVATGGNSEALARLAAAAPDERGISLLPLGELEKVILTLSGLSYRQRVEKLGLREDRADVILPAAVVYARLARQAGVARLLVPFVGLRDGVIADLLDRLAGREQAASAQSRASYEACVSLGRRYEFEEAHALQVMKLALALFDGLRSLHLLGEEERRILMAAALLHDVGFYISYKQHHKHSYYLISNSELPGFTAQQMLLIAHVARYHRKSEPALRHEAFAALSQEEQGRVGRLAALLRIADALDREHLQNIHLLEPRLAGGELRLRLRGTGDFLLARWGLEKKAGLFSRLFGVQVRPDFDEEAP